MVVLIAGLIHPLNLGSPPSYPTYSPTSDVTRFSRYLAARMAGFAVMFSPGFDMPLSAKAADNVGTGRTLMDASGTAVRAASPRALVTAHLNGSALCGDYRSFATVPAPWMTFNLFHSGHAFAAQPPTSDPCPGWQSGSETRVQAALRRATVMPATFSAYTAPSMPSINAEGPYDDVDNPQTDYTLVDTRYRLRQACNYSSLSNARGCSYAITQVGLWSSPASYVGTRASETDMQSLADRFRPYAGLASHPEWIVNNPTPYDQRRALASDGSTIAIAYVPPEDPRQPPINAQITLSTSGLPGLACSGEWTLMWTDPTQEAIPIVLPDNGCQQGTGQITVTAPACSLSKALECDWILTMTRGKAVTTYPAGAAAPGTLSTPGLLDAWRAPGEGDGTSAILAQPISISRGTTPIVVSPSGVAFQDGARVAGVPGGYVVVWHAEGLDGWLLGVFGQRLDAAGKLRGTMFRVNSTTQFDQRDPDIAVDSEGNTVVVWESYGQDGDLGGIFGQLYDRAGMPVGGEFAINEIGPGHQVQPRAAYLAGGGFVVGWTTEALGTDLGAVSFRVFNRNNLPATGEIRLQGGASFHPKLADLSASAKGGLRLRWFLQDNALRTIVSYLREFSQQGAAVGAAGVIP